MKIAGGRADPFADRGQKSNDIMFDDLFDLIDPVQIESRPLLNCLQGSLRHDALLCHGLTGPELNL